MNYVCIKNMCLLVKQNAIAKKLHAKTFYNSVLVKKTVKVAFFIQKTSKIVDLRTFY